MQYQTVARELKEGDVAVVNYTGTCDGKPITDTAPTARGLTESKKFLARTWTRFLSCPVSATNSLG